MTGTTGWTYSYASGDRSSVTVTAPANLTGSPVISVVVGNCNAASPKTLTIGTKASVPVFAGPIPSCIPTNSTAPFTLSVVAQPGVTYTWNKTAGGNWNISAPTTANRLTQVTRQ